MSVAIAGVGFVDTTLLRANFTGAGVSTIVTAAYESSTRVTCSVPDSLPTGQYDVSVSTNGQQFGDAAPFRVTREW
jgi:hypothetical protein